MRDLVVKMREGIDVTVPVGAVEQLRYMLDEARIGYLVTCVDNECTFRSTGYRPYTDEELEQLCYDHGVPIQATDYRGIMRMRMISGLRAAKVIE